MATNVHAGTITASVTADVSQYQASLGHATQAAQQFKSSVNSVSFQGFNRGIIATTTLLYGMNRIMGQMSKGMEEFSNILARIGAVADLTSTSVQALADSMKDLSTSYGVGRTDIMRAMYTTAQSRFTKPSEMRFFSEQATMLSRASGKEIDAQGAAKLMTGLVRSLNLNVQRDVASGQLSDMLLKSRDIGRWELREMAPTIAKVATVFGNEFADRLGGVETLRQMNAIMAVASGTDLPLGMVSTGVRRLVERSYQLRDTARGKYLRDSLIGLGHDPTDPIGSAIAKGPMFYLQDLARISGGRPMDLYKLGFQSRELAAVSAAMSGKGSQLMSAYQGLDPTATRGVTGDYVRQMKDTYEYRREQLSAEWEITSQEFMRASMPIIRSFTDMLGAFNRVARALPDSVKSGLSLVAMMSSFRFLLNLLGVKGSIFGMSSARMTGGGSGAMRFAGAKFGTAGQAISHLTSALEQRDIGAEVSSRMSSAIRNRDILSRTYSTNVGQHITPAEYLAHGSIAGRRNMLMRSHGINYNMLAGGYQLRGAGGHFMQGSHPTLRDAIDARVQSMGGAEKYGAYASRVVPRSELPKTSIAHQLGRYSGAMSGFGRAGYTPSSQDLSAMGVGKFARGLGAATNTVGRFASGLGSLVGPMLKMVVVLNTFGAVMDGLNRKAAPQMFDGKQKLQPKRHGLFGKFMDQHSMGISALVATTLGDGPEAAYEIMSDYANKYGLIADPDSPEAMTRMQALYRTGYHGMKGFRQAKIDDVMGEVWRSHLTPAQRTALMGAGIEPGKFGGRAQEAVRKHLESIDTMEPDNWNHFVAGEGGMSQAMNYVKDGLVALASEMGVAVDAMQSKPVADAVDRLNSVTDAWTKTLMKSLRELMSVFGRNALMFDKQWDIYASSDRLGENARDDIFTREGGKYLGKYQTALDHIQENYGGFAGVDFSADHYKKGTGGWMDKVLKEHTQLELQVGMAGRDIGAKTNFERHRAFREYLKSQPKHLVGRMTQDQKDALFEKEGFGRIQGKPIGDEYESMLDTYESTRNRYSGKLDRKLNAMQYMRVLPDLKNMALEEQIRLYEKHTGRKAEGDPFYDSNFQNYINPKMRDFFQLVQTGGMAQYESATQFGSAQAYNQLLQRDGPEYEMIAHLERSEKHLEKLAYPEESEVDSLYERTMKMAETFFMEADTSNFFGNISRIAEET